MKSISLISAVITAARSGWALASSPVAQTAYPELLIEAELEHWNPQELIRRAIPRIPAWIRGELRLPPGHLLDAISQNFCLEMTLHRPDLFFDAAKGSPQKFSKCILRYVSYRTRHKERLLSRAGWEDFDQPDPDQTEPAERLIEREEREASAQIAHHLLDEISSAQRRAVGVKYLGEDVSDDDKDAPARLIHVRRAHGLRNMRRKGDKYGLRPRTSRSNRTRNHRNGRRRRRPTEPHPCSGQENVLRDDGRCGTLDEHHEGARSMSASRIALESANRRALQRLFSELPESLRGNARARTMLLEIFVRDYARHERRRQRTRSLGR